MFEHQDQLLEAPLADLIFALTEEADRLIQNRRQAHNFVACSAESFKSFGAYFSAAPLRKHYLLSSRSLINTVVPVSARFGRNFPCECRKVKGGLTMRFDRIALKLGLGFLIAILYGAGVAMVVETPAKAGMRVA
jgi:hypothetical protein